MPSFTIYQNISDSVNIQAAKAGCVGTHDGTATCCAYYDNLASGNGAKFQPNDNGKCIKTGAHYNIHVQVGDTRYVAATPAYVPNSGNTDYYLGYDSNGILQLMKSNNGMDGTVNVATTNCG